MAEKALAASRFWQIWTFVGVLGTLFFGLRLLAPAQRAAERVKPQAAPVVRQVPVPRSPNGTPPVAPSVDPLLARLAVAATATERCELLERVQPSEDVQATYAITAVLERAQLGSVRACATHALGRQPTTEARSFLLDLAEDPEPAVYQSAFEALLTRDDAARRVVVDATHSEDLDLRISAIEALLKAKHAEGYTAALLVLPSIEDAETLSSLIDALGQSHDPRALPALERLSDEAERESHLHAISALGELGVASAATRLEGLLEVGSREEFSAAAGALKKLSAERISAQLQAQLSSGNAERQERALSALISLELPVPPALEAELVSLAERSERGEQRLGFAAMRALSSMSSPGARSALQRLAGTLPDTVERRLFGQSPDNPDQVREQRISALTQAEVPLRSVFELAQDPSETAQDALLDYLGRHELGANVWATVIPIAPASTVQRIVARGLGASESENQGVIAGLGQRGDPLFKDTLRARLRADPPTRNAALAALVQLGDDSVLPELTRLARSESASDRELAVQLFSTLPDAEASRELERLASDPDAQVMSSALHGLQTRSPALVGQLAERALREAATEDRADVLASLSDLKASLSRPLLERALGDAEDAVALQAIQSLANLQGPASAQRLLAVVNDSSRSDDVRREAASSLRSLGGPLSRANRALLDSLSEPEPSGDFVCDPR